MGNAIRFLWGLSGARTIEHVPSGDVETSNARFVQPSIYADAVRVGIVLSLYRDSRVPQHRFESLHQAALVGYMRADFHFAIEGCRLEEVLRRHLLQTFAFPCMWRAA